MAHWIESHKDQLNKIRNIVDKTKWSIEFGDSGPLKINHPSGQQITIARITYTEGSKYYKLEHVNSKDPFDDPSDPQRTEADEDLGNIVKFLSGIVS